MANEVISSKLPSATSNKLSIEKLGLLEEACCHESGLRASHGHRHGGEEDSLLLVLIDGLGLEIADW